MSTPGPTRIVLIRSGRYDLAEISLGSSVHLVGHNNVGKTSAIATLQFLYIASFNEMRFSRSWEESARYYFQSDTSYVLFETLTANGRYVTLGLRGRGQMGAYQVDRFAYTGPYSHDDFILEDNRVRTFDEVKNRIASERFFKLLEPSDIRAAVVGESKIPEINMGIVPLKDSSRYGDFIYLFKNLLRLSHLSQQDIKDTLLTVYKRDIRHSAEVDLSREYGDTYTALHAEGIKLQNLKQIMPTVSRLKALRDKQGKARRDLPAMHIEVVTRKARRQIELQQSFDAEIDRLKELDAAIESNSVDLQALRDKTKEVSGSAAVLAQWIRDFETLSKEVKNFIPGIEIQLRQNLERQLNELTGKIHSAGNPNELKTRKEALEQKLHRQLAQREKQHSLLGTKIQKIVGPEKIRNLGKIFNSSLLRLPIEAGAVQIDDEQALKNALMSLDANIRNNVWSGSGVTIPLNLIDAAALTDMETLNSEIIETESVLKKTKDDYEVALNMASLSKQLETLKAELRAAEEQQKCYDRWQKQCQECDPKAALLKDLEKNLCEIDTAQAKLVLNNADNVRRKLLTQETQSKINGERGELDKIRPTPPDPDWPIGAIDPDWPDEALPLFKLYMDTYNGYQGIEAELRDSLYQAEAQYTDGFDGVGTSEKIDAAIELIESMKDQEAAYSTHLGNVIKGMQATFQRLFEALYGLRESAESFNKQIGKVSISNLRRLSLEIIEHTEVTKSYRAIVDMQKADLFADLTETEGAIEKIYDVIRQRPVIKLCEWFGVRFIIETAEGTRKEYDDLSVIESNGTTIAIKTLVNMVLIRALMRDRRPYRIPFYVDEATQVDTPNLKEVVSLANEMGFCPVLASTTPVSVAEYLNFVHMTPNQRAVIDPRRCIHRKALADAKPETA